MGNFCSKTSTQVSIIQDDANTGGNDNIQNTKEIQLGAMTNFFQKKSEEPENNSETIPKPYSKNVVNSQNFVKEDDGLEMSDVC